jgi:hypothetical protein
MGIWSQTVLLPNQDYPYLWNYEVITYTDSSTTDNGPTCIGVHGEKGEPGEPGKDAVAAV